MIRCNTHAVVGNLYRALLVPPVKRDLEGWLLERPHHFSMRKAKFYLEEKGGRRLPAIFALLYNQAKYTRVFQTYLAWPVNG